MKIYKIGIVGRWLGISYIFAHKKISIGLWFVVVEFSLEAKVRGEK